MKRFSILFAILLFSLIAGSTFASQLKIKVHDNRNFILILDGVKYNGPSNFYQFTQVNPGMHHVIIKRRHVRHRHGNRSVVREVLYNGNVRVAPRAKVRLVLNPYREFNVHVVKKAPKAKAHYGVNNSHRGKKYGKNYSAPAARLMSPAEFSNFKRDLRHESFDANRVKMVRHMLDRFDVNARQVAAIVRLMSFEANRLKVAEMAYDYTIDKGNYHLVKRSFAYKSTARRLDMYIRNRY